MNKILILVLAIALFVSAKTWKDENWSFEYPDSPNDGDTVQDCNLTQRETYTPVFKGVKDLVFVNCNLINCLLPDGSTLVGCSAIQKDICDWTVPGWREKNPCAKNCRHVTAALPVVIDGKTIDTVFTRRQKIEYLAVDKNKVKLTPAQKEITEALFMFPEEEVEKP